MQENLLFDSDNKQRQHGWSNDHVCVQFKKTDCMLMFTHSRFVCNWSASPTSQTIEHRVEVCWCRNDTWAVWTESGQVLDRYWDRIALSSLQKKSNTTDILYKYVFLWSTQQSKYHQSCLMTGVWSVVSCISNVNHDKLSSVVNPCSIRIHVILLCVAVKLIWLFLLKSTLSSVMPQVWTIILTLSRNIILSCHVTSWCFAGWTAEIRLMC